MSSKNMKCIGSKTLIKAFSNELSTEEKIKILDHIAICPDCSLEFNILKEVWAQRKKSINKLDEIELNTEDINHLKKVAKGEIKKIRSLQKQEKRPVFHNKRILAVASGAALVIAIAISVLIIKGPLEMGVERTSPDLEIKLIEPRDQVSKTPLTFIWNPVKRASHYYLEILDRGLETAYLSDLIENDRFTLPDHIFRTLKRNETYFWKITAIIEGNDKIESDFGRFQIPEE